MLLGPRGVSLSSWKLWGLFIRVPGLTLRSQPGLQSLQDGVGRVTGTGELPDASPLAGILGNPGVAQVQNFTHSVSSALH